jgi:hypothetical protein
VNSSATRSTSSGYASIMKATNRSGRGGLVAANTGSHGQRTRGQTSPAFDLNRSRRPVAFSRAC